MEQLRFTSLRRECLSTKIYMLSGFQFVNWGVASIAIRAFAFPLAINIQHWQVLLLLFPPHPASLHASPPAGFL